MLMVEMINTVDGSRSCMDIDALRSGGSIYKRFGSGIDNMLPSKTHGLA